MAFTIGRIEVEEEDVPPSTEAADEQADAAAEKPGAVLDATGLGFVEPDDEEPDDLAEAKSRAPEVGVPVMDPDDVRAPEEVPAGG